MIADHTFNWENWVAPDGRLLWVSPAVEEVTGYTIEECLAMPDYPGPLVHEEDRAEMMDLYRKTCEGDSGRDHLFRIRRKDGIVLWGSVSWHPVYDSQGGSPGTAPAFRM